MNNNKKELEIIIKKPSRKELDEFPQKRRPTINAPIVNPFTMWREEFAETKEGAYAHGFIQGLTWSRRNRKNKIKENNDNLSSPAENFLGNFTDNLVETKREAFVLGFIQGIAK